MSSHPSPTLRCHNKCLHSLGLRNDNTQLQGYGFCALVYGRFANKTQRRRAQNRAAQRAFRERKEKHARDLEVQLAALNEKYNKLESSHTELNAAYEKLRKTIELLTHDGDAAADDDNDDEGNISRRRGSNSETLRKLLEIIHGDFKGIALKNETP
jgi:AP-1-like factor